MSTEPVHHKCDVMINQMIGREPVKIVCKRTPGNN